MHLCWQFILTLMLLVVGNKRAEVQASEISKISRAESNEALEPLKIVPPNLVDDDESYMNYIDQPLAIVPPKADEHATMSPKRKAKQIGKHKKTRHPKQKYEKETKSILQKDQNVTLANQLKDLLEKRIIVLYGIGAVNTNVELTSLKRPANDTDNDWLFILINLCSICTIFVVIFIVISPLVSRKSSLYGPVTASNIHPSVNLSISPSD